MEAVKSVCMNSGTIRLNCGPGPVPGGPGAFAPRGGDGSSPIGPPHQSAGPRFAVGARVCDPQPTPCKTRPQNCFDFRWPSVGCGSQSRAPGLRRSPPLRQPGGLPESGRGSSVSDTPGSSQETNRTPAGCQPQRIPVQSTGPLPSSRCSGVSGERRPKIAFAPPDFISAFYFLNFSFCLRNGRFRPARGPIRSSGDKSLRVGETFPPHHESPSEGNMKISRTDPFSAGLAERC
jgi:hypothetical protein